MEERTQRAGEHSNNDIYLYTCTHAVNEAMGGMGTRREQTKTYSRIYLLFTQSLSQFTT